MSKTDDTNGRGGMGRNRQSMVTSESDSLHPNSQTDSVEVCGMTVQRYTDGGIGVHVPAPFVSLVTDVLGVVKPSWVGRLTDNSDDGGNTSHSDTSDTGQTDNTVQEINRDEVSYDGWIDDRDDNGGEDDDGGSDENDELYGNEKDTVTIRENGNHNVVCLGVKMLESIGVADADKLRCVVDGDVVIYMDRESDLVCDGARGVKNLDSTNAIKMPYDVFDVGDDVERDVRDDRIIVRKANGDTIDNDRSSPIDEIRNRALSDSSDSYGRVTAPMKQKTLKNIRENGIIHEYCNQVVEMLDDGNISADDFDFQQSVCSNLDENSGGEPTLPNYTSPSAVESIVCSRLND